MPAPVRLGLAGAGRWGRNYIRTIAGLSGVRLARVASNNPATVDLLPPGCLLVGSWRDLLDPSGDDGVIVSTPPASHAEIACAAIMRGLPVLIEKPLALSTADARAIRDLANDRHVYAVVEHTHLFSPAFRALKAFAMRHGGAREIHGEAGNQGPYRDDVSVLWDWGPHDVAMCLDLMQAAPSSIACTLRERSERNGGMAETVEIRLAFPAGVASILLSNMTDKKRRLSVRCADTELVYDDLSAQKLLIGGKPVALADDLPLTVAVQEFAAAIGMRRGPRGDLDLGVGVVQVLEACSRAAS